MGWLSRILLGRFHPHYENDKAVLQRREDVRKLEYHDVSRDEIWARIVDRLLEETESGQRRWKPYVAHTWESDDYLLFPRGFRGRQSPDYVEISLWFEGRLVKGYYDDRLLELWGKLTGYAKQWDKGAREEADRKHLLDKGVKDGIL